MIDAVAVVVGVGAAFGVVVAVAVVVRQLAIGFAYLLTLHNVDCSSLPTSAEAAFGHYTAYDVPWAVPSGMVHVADMESYSIRLVLIAFPLDLLRATVVSNLSKPI